jgi:type I restriction enzyme S subunit
MEMTKRFKRYAAYKDSGVEWLGEIPAHWEVKRLKTIAAVQLSNVDKKSVEGQESVRLCNYVDVYYSDRIGPDLDFMAATATPEQVRRFSLRAGDVLITKDSESWTDIAVPAVVASDLPDVLCGYHLALVRPMSDCDGAFLARAFSAIGPRDQFQVAANGITRFGLGGDAIRTGLFPTPPAQEQRAIAAFLDRETARIDALVAKKERLIELLQEKRTALISRAVTKGLDAKDRLLATGSAVFPEVPERWELRKLRRLIRRVKRPVVVEPETEYREIGIRSWGKGIFHKDPLRGALLEDKSVFYIEPNDLVLNIVFAWEGAVAAVSGSELGMVASHRFPTFRHSEEVALDYLLMVLQSEQGRALMGINSPGAAGRNRTIRLDQFLDEEVALPSLAEQREFVGAFRTDARRLDALLAKLHDAIEHFKELRTALISAAVTGKIDVRGEVAGHSRGQDSSFRQ